MKKMKALLCIVLALLMMAVVLTACDDSSADSSSGGSGINSAEEGKISSADMEKAVHNSFSDSFCKTIDDSDMFSMTMHSEGDYVVWELTFENQLSDSELEIYKKTIEENDLTENLSNIRSAVKNDVESTDFHMIVRYFNKDGSLILEQKAE